MLNNCSSQNHHQCRKHKGALIVSSTTEMLLCTGSQWVQLHSECSRSHLVCPLNRLRAEWGSPWWYFIVSTVSSKCNWGSHFERYWILYQWQSLGLGSMCWDKHRRRHSQDRWKEKSCCTRSSLCTGSKIDWLTYTGRHSPLRIHLQIWNKYIVKQLKLWILW